MKDRVGLIINAALDKAIKHAETGLKDCGHLSTSDKQNQSNREYFQQKSRDYREAIEILEAMKK